MKFVKYLKPLAIMISVSSFYRSGVALGNPPSPSSPLSFQYRQSHNLGTTRSDCASFSEDTGLTLVDFEGGSKSKEAKRRDPILSLSFDFAFSAEGFASGFFT